ncbi:uncharacterized protein J3R85_010552 [Psidium guajava]|nr:uncharacterized protein J3R85_010552 [Psidium guajava]
MITRRLKTRTLHRLAISRSYHSSQSLLTKPPLSPSYDQSHRSNAFSINRSMVDSIRKKRPTQALSLFKEQLQLGVSGDVDEATISLALKACNGDLGLCCQVHGFAISSGYVSFTTVSNSLMNAYTKGGSFDRALYIFENLERPDTVSWNTVLSGFPDSEDALSFGVRMNLSGVGFDAVTYTTLLAMCLDYEGFLFGLQLHGLVIKFGLDTEVFVGNALITLYSRQDMLEHARKVFDEIPSRDIVSWNAMISGYTKEGSYGAEAIRLFIEMVREGMKLDHVSFTSAVSACGYERNWELGRQIHGLTIKAGYEKQVSVGNVLISNYLKSEAVEDAQLVFTNLSERNVVSWTTMISMDEDAVSLFNQMRVDEVYPNDVTFVGLLHFITNNNLVKEGEMIHEYCLKTGFCSELNVSNSLITMYAKFGTMENSLKIFEELNYREIISWNALISGYTQNGRCQEAVETFFLATKELQPSKYTFGSVLSAIGTAEAISLRHGQRCHSHLAKLGLDTDPIVSGALLDMYAKRGSISESLKVFHETPVKSQFAWTAIISAYARHGDCESVIRLFKEMEREGIKPDEITFLSVLTACVRKGMVDMGQELFDSMVEEYLIEPSPEHYSCMVDLLGRAGRLNEAEELASRIPGGPGLSVLQSLLGSCRVHGNIMLAERIVDAVMNMEPTESGSYVLMSNLYAEMGLWEEAARVRKGMRERGVRKEIGFSWVDVGDPNGSLCLHGFSSGDMSHPRAEDIFRMVECLGSEMQFLRERQRQRETEMMLLAM